MVRVYQNSRHIRWNWEESPDNFFDGNPMVRYHFVVVDDKNREVKMGSIIKQLTDIQQGIVEVREIEGKIKDAKFRYLFRSYDSPVAPSNLHLWKISSLVKHDKNLKERVRGSIEDYVVNQYNK